MFDILNLIQRTEHKDSAVENQLSSVNPNIFMTTTLKPLKSPIKTTVPALDRSIAILDFVCQCEAPPTAAQITKALDLPRSSAHGLISALVAHGLLHKNNAQRYTVSGHVMRWTNGFLAQQDVVLLFTTDIASRPELSVYSLTLTHLEERDVVCLACHNGASHLGFTFHIGLRLPASFAATGKAILSTEDDEIVEVLFQDNWHTPLTPHSIPDKATLLTELAETRKRGYSIDDRQIRDGMFCIGVPVFDYSQCARYGIALSMQKADADAQTIRSIGTVLRRHADALSRRLGAVL